MKKMRECNNCEEWEANIKKLEDIQLFCMNQSAAPKAESKVFDYCPWCGHYLTEDGLIGVIQEGEKDDQR